MKTKSVFLATMLLHVRLFAGPATDPALIAHEWGTFTSVQGADGVQFEWNPLVTSELPGFVYDRARPARLPKLSDSDLVGKNSRLALQRMETPVIYFYSGVEQKVNVSVQFPEGIVTEWFPQAAKYDRRLMEWNDLRLTPVKKQPELEKLLPQDASGSHYFAARETDSDFIRADNVVGQAVTTENEKFIFYRGIGFFKAPLEIRLGQTDDVVILKNTGSEPLSHLYVLFVRNGKGKYLSVDNLPGGKEQTVNLNLQYGQSDLTKVRGLLARDMAKSLTGEGLFGREAEAMVKTWDDSWFGEDGLRVLYTLPRAWTDRVLPLKISPAPAQITRVMVGRAEMITPSMEWDLLKEITRYGESSAAAKEQAIANTRGIGLGRFTEAAVRHLTSKMPNREFNQAAWNLLNAAGKPSDKKFASAR
jgi:hypothetical protein